MNASSFSLLPRQSALSCRGSRVISLQSCRYPPATGHIPAVFSHCGAVQAGAFAHGYFLVIIQDHIRYSVGPPYFQRQRITDQVRIHGIVHMAVPITPAVHSAMGAKLFTILPLDFCQLDGQFPVQLIHQPLWGNLPGACAGSSACRYQSTPSGCPHTPLPCPVHRKRW